MSFDANFLWVLSGGIMLSISAALSGTFAYLNKRSLIGDALAHCALPGVLMAFLLAQTNSTGITLIGGTASAFLGYVTLEWLTNKKQISPDSALAIVLSLFFSIGVLILSIIQRLPIPGKGGLDKLFFGQAASLTQVDVIYLFIILLIVSATVFVFFHALRGCAFDRKFMQLSTLKPKHLDLIIGCLLVIVVVIGLQLVGVILMSALLLIPALIARQLTYLLSKLLAIAIFCGMVSVVVGVYLSSEYSKFPTGPWIVVTLTTLFIISALFSPYRGVIHQLWTQHKRKKIRLEENVLRACFLLQERFNKPSFTLNDILSVREFPSHLIEPTAKRLLKKGLFVNHQPDLLQLTEAGARKAIELTRNHRLWEAYLTKKVGLEKHVVHPIAEEVEHILTPTMAREVESELNQVKLDPHGKTIPTLPAK